MPGLVGSRLQTERFRTSCKLHSLFCCEKPSDSDRLQRTIRKAPEASAFSNQGNAGICEAGWWVQTLEQHKPKTPAQYFHPWTQTAHSGHVSKRTFHPSVKMWEERAPCIVPLWLMIFVFGHLAIYVAVNLGCFLVGGKREQGATPGAQLLSLFHAL